VLLKLRAQPCKLRIDVAQPRLVGLAELRSGADEVDVITLDQAHGFGIETERVAPLMQRFDAREQIRVQQDRILVRSELRRELRLQRLAAVVRVRADEGIEDRRGALEQLSGPLERDDSVLE